jgi:hypothetical protein
MFCLFIEINPLADAHIMILLLLLLACLLNSVQSLKSTYLSHSESLKIAKHMVL